MAILTMAVLAKASYLLWPHSYLLTMAILILTMAPLPRRATHYGRTDYGHTYYGYAYATKAAATLATYPLVRLKITQQAQQEYE